MALNGGKTSKPSNGKTRIVGGVVVDYTAGHDHNTYLSVDESICAPERVMVDAVDTTRHAISTVTHLINIHMATPKRSDIVARFCASGMTSVPRLDAAIKGHKAVLLDMREGLEKRKIRDTIQAQMEKKVEQEEKRVQDKKRKLDEELETFRQEKRRKADERIAEELAAKLKKDEAKTVKIEKLEKSLEEEES